MIRISEKFKIVRVDNFSQLKYTHHFRRQEFSTYQNHTKFLFALELPLLSINEVNYNVGGFHDNFKDYVSNINSEVLEIFQRLRLILRKPIGFQYYVFEPLNHFFESECSVESVNLIEKNFMVREELFSESYNIFESSKLKAELTNLNNISTNILLAIKKIMDYERHEDKFDTVLDLATAYESILSKSSDSIGYKVSLRAALIIKEIMVPEWVFTVRDVKKVLGRFYSLRSSIVHGASKKITTNETCLISTGTKIGTRVFAYTILTYVIKYLADNPKYDDLQELDYDLILK